MKPTASLIASICIACTITSNLSAQLYIGNTGNDLYISSGGYLVYDGLKLSAPVSPITLSDNILTKSSVAVGGMSGSSSINRVFDFTNAVTFTGNLDIYYSDAELNGNTETQLRIAYKRPNDTWITSSTGSVDATNNIVTDNFNSVSFKSVTAVAAGSTLPLLENSFRGYMSGDVVELTWKVDQSFLYSHFEVESSADSRSWKKAETIQAANIDGTRDYRLKDHDIDFTLRFYRLKLVMLSGSVYYSPVISVNNNSAFNTRFVSLKGGLKIWFTGWQPNAIQLYDMKGRLIKTGTLNQPVWETNGLTPGIYMVHAENEMQKTIKKVFVY